MACLFKEEKYFGIGGLPTVHVYDSILDKTLPLVVLLL